MNNNWSNWLLVHLDWKIIQVSFRYFRQSKISYWFWYQYIMHYANTVILHSRTMDVFFLIKFKYTMTRSYAIIMWTNVIWKMLFMKNIVDFFYLFLADIDTFSIENKFWNLRPIQYETIATPPYAKSRFISSME